MSKRMVRYRLDVDYYSKSYDDRACMISSPIYNKKEGVAEYMKALNSGVKCFDDPSKPIRIHLWKYSWDDSGRCVPISIMKNY